MRHTQLEVSTSSSCCKTEKILHNMKDGVTSCFQQLSVWTLGYV